MLRQVARGDACNADTRLKSNSSGAAGLPIHPHDPGQLTAPTSGPRPIAGGAASSILEGSTGAAYDHPRYELKVDSSEDLYARDYRGHRGSAR